MNIISQLQELQKEIDRCEKLQNEAVVASWGKVDNSKENKKWELARQTIEVNRVKMRELILEPQNQIEVEYEHATAV